MFEKASRQKLRFSTDKGLLSVEDLWDLPLTSNTKVNLNDIAKALYTQIQNTSVSFVDDVIPLDESAKLSFNIVKHIIDVKKEENSKRLLAAQKQEEKQRILELINQKKDDSLTQLSVQELENLLKAL